MVYVDDNTKVTDMVGHMVSVRECNAFYVFASRRRRRGNPNMTSQQMHTG
jgi:hypothetical protein